MPRRRRSAGTWFQHHALPFLSIMLGLIAVMALASMGLASIKRIDETSRRFVKLANVPPQLVPFHIICEDQRILWRKDGQWKEFDFHPRDKTAIDLSAIEFVNELATLAEKNRSLSFRGKQNTIILWIRPDGVLTSKVIELHASKLPLRVGKLPLLKNEDVSFEGVGR